jgi:hypothetical protein
MAPRLPLALALVALLAGCGSGTTTPRFREAVGWHLRETHGEAVAANVDVAPADRGVALPPFHTVASLPRTGTLIWATVMPRGPAAYENKPTVPPRVADALPSDTPDGAPCAPAVRCLAASDAIRLMRLRLHQRDVLLIIFFGTDHPPAGQIRAANAELARLSP